MTDAQRSYSWTPFDGPGRSDLPGLEQVRGQIAGDLPVSPAAATLGYHPVELGEGWAVIEVEPREFHCNTNGTVQGGVIAAVIDSALGSALMTVNTGNRKFSTLDLNCRYIRAILPGSGAVRVRGRLAASATSTLLVLDP